MNMPETEVISEKEGQGPVVTGMEVVGPSVTTEERIGIGLVLMIVTEGEIIFRHTIGTEEGYLLRQVICFLVK